MTQFKNSVGLLDFRHRTNTEFKISSLIKEEIIELSKSTNADLHKDSAKFPNDASRIRLQWPNYTIYNP